jgi:hypothetical protein
MKNMGKVHDIMFIGRNQEKSFVTTSRIHWKPKKVIGLYLGNGI